MANKMEKIKKSEIQEKDLLDNFDSYQKYLEELFSKYPTEKTVSRPLIDTQEIEYITEAIFSYQINATT